MNTQIKYAIIRYHQPANGRTYYQAREVGSVTCLKKNLWSTTDRAAAERLASEVGGTAVSL